MSYALLVPCEVAKILNYLQRIADISRDVALNAKIMQKGYEMLIAIRLFLRCNRTDSTALRSGHGTAYDSVAVACLHDRAYNSLYALALEALPGNGEASGFFVPPLSWLFPLPPVQDVRSTAAVNSMVKIRLIFFIFVLLE